MEKNKEKEEFHGDTEIGNEEEEYYFMDHVEMSAGNTPVSSFYHPCELVNQTETSAGNTPTNPLCRCCKLVDHAESSAGNNPPPNSFYHHCELVDHAETSAGNNPMNPFCHHCKLVEHGETSAGNNPMNPFCHHCKSVEHGETNAGNTRTNVSAYKTKLYTHVHSFYGESRWPESYRQSMDIYSSLPSRSFSMFSPRLQHFNSSFFGSSFIKPKLSPETVDLQEPLNISIPTEAEQDSYDYLPLLSSRHQLTMVTEAYEPERGCSATQATMNGINVLCGVGILSTPYALKEGGWLGISILFTIAIVAWSTGLLLRDCLDSQEGIETYPDIGKAAFGTFGRILISILLYTELYACCVEFLILEGDNLAVLYPHVNMTNLGIMLGPKETFIIITGVCLLPTVWLRDLSLLSYVSAGGVIASIIVVFTVFWIGFVDGVGVHPAGQALNVSNLPVSVGLYGFCYSGHSVFPNIYTSLKKQNQFPKVLMASILICTTMYVGVAIMGFSMFGDSTQSQITLNLPQEYMASQIAVWTTIVNPFTKYALTITPVALSLEELLPSMDSRVASNAYSMAIRTVLVMSTLCVAISVPFFAYVMAFTGSFLSMLLCIIMPALCFLQIVGDKATATKKIFCILIILVGVACAIAGTYSSVTGIINSYKN